MLLLGGELLKIISENCFWTKIFQYQSVETFFTMWGCGKKQWAILFRNNESTYQLHTSLFGIPTNFETNRNIHLNQVAKNLYVINLRNGRRLEETQNPIKLFSDDVINNLDKIFICPILSTKNITLEPVFNKDYFIYNKGDVPTSGSFVYEHLKQFHVVININKYSCPKKSNRFKSILFNLNSGKFRIEIVKTEHNSTHCFYCNTINKIKLNQHKNKSNNNENFIFSPRYTQAILNF